MTRPSCTLFVLNYNGQDLLKQCFPSVVEAAQKSKLCDVDVVVVDNHSKDASLEWLNKSYPSVSLLPSPGNWYLYSLNWAAGQVKSDYLVLLNNDVIMEPDSLDPLFEPLLQSNLVFSVTSLLLRPDKNTLDAGKRWGEFRRGFLHHSTMEDVAEIAPTLFPTGGAFAISRQQFLAYGGFDELYHPAYWEDVDLGYRAWKSGYVNLFQPASVMYHIKAGSWGKEDQEKVKQIDLRNSWLFTWRNVHDLTILAANLGWTLRYYLSALKRREWSRQQAFQQAFRRWPQSLKHRKPRNTMGWTDREICNLVNTSTLSWTDLIKSSKRGSGQ